MEIFILRVERFGPFRAPMLIYPELYRPILCYHGSVLGRL
jgi:hypothetical protein